MAGLSRVPTHGTVFTRVRNLIRAGVIKDRDRPIWYDVMVAFPPKVEDELQGVEHGPFIREILYPEDNIRAKFYKVYGSVRSLNMNRQNTVSTSPCARFIAKYQELQQDWDKSEEELFEETARELQKEGLPLTRKGEKRKPIKLLVSKQLSSSEVASQTLAMLFKKSTEDKRSETGSAGSEVTKKDTTSDDRTELPSGESEDKR